MSVSALSYAIALCEQSLTTGSNLNRSCYGLGNVLQSLGRFQEAVIWHTHAVEQNPPLEEICASLGGLYAKQEQWQDAIAAYQKALQLNPAYAEVHRSLAGIYAVLGNRSIEVSYSHQAVRLYSDWVTSENQFILANSLLEVGQIEAAIDCYHYAIQLQPNFFEAYYNLGIVLIEQQQWQQANQALQQAIGLNPNYAAAHYGLGKIAEVNGQWQQAIEHYQRAIELDPDLLKALHSLGELQLQYQDWQAAISVYHRILQLTPESFWAHHHLGYALGEQGQYQEAEAVLQQAIQLDSSVAWTFYYLGTILLRQQKWREATGILFRTVQLQPDFATAYLKLGYVLRQQVQQDGEATLQFYRQQILDESTHFHAESFFETGQILLDHKQFCGAIVLYHLGLMLQPNYPPGWEKLHHAQSCQQQLVAEFNRLHQEIQQYPDCPWFYSQLANLLADQGEIEDAVTLIRQASMLWGWHQVSSRHYRFSHDWFTHNIPTWTQYLQPYAGVVGVRGLEIGSFEGMSACWLFDHILTHPTAHLTCIDHYFQASFDSNITQTGALEKLTKQTQDSHLVLSALESDSYDFIYIDGCHLADVVQQDATLSWRLLKTGGLMIFDDYAWSDPQYPGRDCQIGIHAFLASIPDRFEQVHQDYQLLIRKCDPLLYTEFEPESRVLLVTQFASHKEEV